MQNITEDYVSFDTAKLLKEKGFDEYCGYYSSDGEYWGYCTYNHRGKDYISAPTLQMAMKWLRDVHKIDITVDPHKIGNNWIYQFHICQNKDYLFSKDIGTSYENCAESAIKYCLKNLI